MNKYVFKYIFITSAKVGATAGPATVFIVVLMYILFNWLGSPYGLILFFGNLILYLPLGLIGGALAGLILGTFFMNFSRIISKGTIEPNTAMFFGGLMGGILVGIAPIFIGFGYLY